MQIASNPQRQIEVPTAETAIRHSLAADGAWARPDAVHNEIQPLSKVVWAEPSNEARYLEGVLSMTGGLDDAEAYLLHPFLKNMFASLGGTPNLSPENVKSVANSLKKQRGRSLTFDLRNENEITVLASLIVKAAKGLKTPVDDIVHEDLRDDWAAYCAAFWQRRSQPKAADSGDRIVERGKKSLDACLIGMRRRKMLFQGHLSLCRECHHKNWVDMSALKPTLACDVCGATAAAPVDFQWRFRPNQFLIESLRDHSVLSLVWVMSALRDRSRSSFMYAQPTSFGYTKDHASNAEADLLVISDGHAILCEVKSSWRLVRTSDVKEFVALACKLRPDQALFAVMEEGAGPVADFKQARHELAAAGIEFDVMTPPSDDRYDNPYLHEW